MTTGTSTLEPATGSRDAARLTISGFPVKASREREFWTMRGLMMALFALDFPGHNGTLRVNHWAGRIGAPFLSSMTKTKTITKTTAKTV